MTGADHEVRSGGAGQAADGDERTGCEYILYDVSIMKPGSDFSIVISSVCSESGVALTAKGPVPTASLKKLARKQEKTKVIY